jgi:Flp pilus assembly protein TadB
MSVREVLSACLAAAAGLLLLATHGWDAWHKPRTRRRFQRSAAQAAADVAAARAARDLAKCRAIWPDAPTRIHQTRRTEEDQ